MWEVVDECLTQRGFKDLNEMVAQGEPDDLWNSFTKMGFNNSIQLDECCPIRIEFAAEKDVMKISWCNYCFGDDAIVHKLIDVMSFRT